MLWQYTPSPRSSIATRRMLLLEVVWALVLLMHLGGHDGITAYNIEDNELWSRHLVTAVSQVTVAIYVFCKSWSPPAGGDKRLLQAAILLFVPRVLKCLMKPWALKMASIYSLVSSPDAVKPENEGDMSYTLEQYVRRAKLLVVGREQTEEGDEAQGAAAAAADSTSSISVEDEEGHHPRSRRTDDMMEPPAGKAQKMKEMLQGNNETSKLFVDLSSSSYSRRLSILKDFCKLTTEKRAYSSVRQGLATAFLLLYTKLKTVNMNTIDDDDEAADDTITVQRMFSLAVQLSRMFLPWAAIGLFHHSHRQAYNDIDVKITYVMICCAAVLESYSFFAVKLTSQGNAGDEWPEMVAQCSFIGGYATSSNKQQMMLFGMAVPVSRRLLGRIGLFKDFLDQQHWRSISPSFCFSSRRITGLVHQYLKAGWKQKVHDVAASASYRRFNDNRGQWALEKNEVEDKLGWSIKGPFDESVLLWHIATDFRFFLSSPSSASDHICALDKIPSSCTLFLGLLSACASRFDDSESEGDERRRRTSNRWSSSNKCGEEVYCKSILSRQMSNYMAYLLLVNPEMLLPGSRRNLCTGVQEELEALFNNNGDDRPRPGLDSGELAQNIGDKLKSLLSSSSSAAPGPPPPETYIHKAWMLAEALRSLNDDDKMWEVIQGVWVEMLCYSAGRCRGYLHAKALGEGGEFLSYVWLLLFYMGMETFTDKLQREDLPSHEAAAAETGTTGNNVNAAANAPTPTTPDRVSSTIGTTAASASEAHDTDDAAGASAAAPSTSEICMMSLDDMV